MTQEKQIEFIKSFAREDLLRYEFTGWGLNPNKIIIPCEVIQQEMRRRHKLSPRWYAGK